MKKERASEDYSDETKSKKRMSSKEMQELLVENFVGLQKAMTNLSIKFESMTDQILKLLQIYEISAKNFMTGSESPENTKGMLDKIDSLLEQNKTIAKGLVLLEEKLRGRPDQPSENEDYQKSVMTDLRPKPLPSQKYGQ